MDTINSNFYSQHVVEPTFGPNFLDLILTEDPSLIFAVNIAPPLGLTRKLKLHASLTGELNLKKSMTKTEHLVPKPDFNRGNFFEFDRIIADNCQFFLSKNTNTSYKLLIEAYDLAMKKWVPSKKDNSLDKLKPQPKWFNREIKQATSLLYKLHCKLTASSNNHEVKSN